MNTIIRPQFASFPQGYCPTSFEEFWLFAWSLTTLQIPGQFIPYVVQASQPTVEDQKKLWIKVDSNGNPIGQFKYSPSFGWVWPHPVPPPVGNAYELRFARFDDPADVATYDGGEVGAVGPRSGPFWEIDPDMVGHFPVGRDAEPIWDSAQVFDTGTPDDPPARYGFWIRRTARIYYAGA